MISWSELKVIHRSIRSTQATRSGSRRCGLICWLVWAIATPALNPVSNRGKSTGTVKNIRKSFGCWADTYCTSQLYVKWALKGLWRLFDWRDLLNEQTWLQHLKENAWLMDYLKTV